MADQVVKVVSPEGQPGEIPASQLEDATEQGFRLLTPEVQAEIARHEKYGGAFGLAGASVAGGARGITGGLSDLALTKTGIVEPKTLSDLKEEHPTASIVSEIGGTLLPIVGELGLGAKLGGEALGGAGKLVDAVTQASPVGLATKLGAGIEGGLSKAMGSQIAAKIVGATARGAAEAELYNIGHNISEASLGDESLTAERLLAHSGDALAVGAGLGFGISAGGLALKAAAQKASGALDGLSSFVAEKFPLANPETLNNYAEKTAARHGMEPEEVKSLFTKVGEKEGQELRADLGTKPFVTPEERDQVNRTFKDTLGEARDNVNKIKSKAFDEMRPKEIGNLVREVDTKAVSESAYQLADDIKVKVAEMEANPDIFSATGLVKKMKGIEDGYAKRVLAVESPEELYNLVNDTKKLIDKQAKIWGRSIDPAQAETVNAVKGMRDAFKNHLTNEELWGAAATRQAAFNDSFNRLATAEANLFGKPGKAGAFTTKVVTRSGSVVSELSPKKINTFLSQTGAARSELQETALREYLEAAKDFAVQVEQSAGSAQMEFSREGVSSLIEKTQKIAADAEKKLGLESKVRQAARLDDIGMNMFPGTAAAAVGSVLHSIPGAAAVGLGAKAVGGAAADLLRSGSNPIAAAKTLSRIEGFALGPAKQMARAIDAMTKAASAVGETAIKREVGVAARLVVSREEDSLTRFHRAQAQVRDAANDGIAQMAAYQAGTTHMSEHAPKTQRALVSKQLEVAQFLKGKLPTNPFADTSTNPKTATWRPSDAQMAAYHRYHQAAVDPMGTIKRAASGVVSPEGVETLKTLYPGLYSDFRQQLFERVAMTGKPLPRQAAVALSAMFDIPLTPSMRPDVRKALASMPEQEKPEQKPHIPQRKSKTSEHLRSGEQSRAER